MTQTKFKLHVYIPAIATEILLLFLFCPFKTYFGPFGPFSGDIQHYLYILKVPLIPKHVVNGENKNNNKISVAIAGIFERYTYNITQ
jgi:hypothetical protein